MVTYFTEQKCMCSKYCNRQELFSIFYTIYWDVLRAWWPRQTDRWIDGHWYFCSCKVTTKNWSWVCQLVNGQTAILEEIWIQICFALVLHRTVNHLQSKFNFLHLFYYDQSDCSKNLTKIFPVGRVWCVWTGNHRPSTVTREQILSTVVRITALIAEPLLVNAYYHILKIWFQSLFDP